MSENSLKEGQKQAAIASRQWKVMRRAVKEKKVTKDEQAISWYSTIFASMDEEHVTKLDNICNSWESGEPKERAVLCRNMQGIIFELRPHDSVILQGETIFDLGGSPDTGSILVFLEIFKLMKSKMEMEERGGYTEEDHDNWDLTVDSICNLISMGLPVGMGMFSYKVAKEGNEPRNRNSKIASYLQHLKVKDHRKWESHTAIIKEAVDKKVNDKKSDANAKAVARAYLGKLEFDSAKVTADDSMSDAGLFTGMANVDWLLLAAYHSRKAGYNHDESLSMLKGVAAFTLLCPLTKVRAASLRTEWPVFEAIAARFEKGKEIYMCPMALTPSRLVNCAAILYEAASDMCILRADWTHDELHCQAA